MQIQIHTLTNTVSNMAGIFLPAEVSSISNTKIFDRYALSVIGDRMHELIGVEVHGIRNPEDEQSDCTVDDMHPQFFSVFAQFRDGGGERVGDFMSYADARDYATELEMDYYLPVHDAIQAQYQRYAKFHFVDYRADDLVDAYPLSNGCTVFRRLAPNGSKTVFMLDRNTLTEAEFDEFHRALRSSSAELN